MTNNETSPALKEYRVWADSNIRVCQEVEALSPEEGHELARKNPNAWKSCLGQQDSDYTLSDEVMDLKTEEFIKVGNPLARGLRQASQHLYNAIQDYLDVPDSELPRDLVEAMDGMEAAWRKADGTTPEDHEHVA